jgi:opacity protein-like surface antigen
MPYRNTVFCAAAAVAFAGFTSPAFSQTYIRADLGWAWSTNANVHNINQAVVNPLANTVRGITGTLSDLGSAGTFGIGAGFRFLTDIRTDLVYTYRGGFQLDGADQAIPSNRFKGDVASNSVMATAYWDYPFTTTTTAFVGLGLGWADVSLSNLSSSTGGLTVNPLIVGGTTAVPVALDGRSDNLAWQITTGFAFPVGNGLQMEIYYKYFDAGHVRTPAGNITVDGTVVGVYGGAEGALHSHELAVSLRVPLT